MKNRFAKSIAAVLFSLAFTVVCVAQETCELASKNAPILFNLQIGMLSEQVQNIFGRDLKVKIKKKGERTFFQNFIKRRAPVPLNGVRALYLRFFDGKLYQVEIFYEARQNFSSLENIINTLATQLDFSVSEWKIENNRAQINCGEISVIADNILNPRIELTNQIVRAEIEELRKAK